MSEPTLRFNEDGKTMSVKLTGAKGSGIIGRSGMRFKCVFDLECWRWHDEFGKRFRNLKGQFERRLIWQEHCHNIVTDEGLDSVLDVYFHAATQITTWYCCMSESDTAAAANLTYAVPGYTETEAYDEGTRPAYNEAAASGQSITNSANKAAFTINAAKTLYGASLVGGGTDGDTKGDAAGGGTLCCYAKFGSSRAVVDDDVVNLTYTVTAADDGV